jgi:hypothetical protein
VAETDEHWVVIAMHYLRESLEINKENRKRREKRRTCV